MAKKRPAVGDRIRHHEPHFNRVTEGVVNALYSAQFVYITDDYRTCYCMFKENWEIIK